MAFLSVERDKSATDRARQPHACPCWAMEEMSDVSIDDFKKRRFIDDFKKRRSVGSMRKRYDSYAEL